MDTHTAVFAIENDHGRIRRLRLAGLAVDGDPDIKRRLKICRLDSDQGNDNRREKARQRVIEKYTRQGITAPPTVDEIDAEVGDCHLDAQIVSGLTLTDWLLEGGASQTSA